MSLPYFIVVMQDVDVTDFSSWPYGLKLIGTVMVGGLILLAVHTLFYAPKLESLEISLRKEAGLKQTLMQKQRLAINLPAYQTQMIEIKNRFKNVLRQLPSKSEIPSLLIGISQAGTELGMIFKRFKPAKAEESDFFVRLPIQIQTSGSYHQLASFVSSIANLKRIVTIGDFDIKRANPKSRQNETDPSLILTANISTYHFNDIGRLSAEQHISDLAQ